jgi:cytochrome d ubiquinol oxidase subunit II
METFWFVAFAFMIIMFVILDGFDLGTGILYLKAAKTDEERRMLLNAIGPVWDGNEVWLIAAGGTLFFAFPLVYASGFSGFYLPLTIVLWLLIGRALGIELRKHVDSPLWKSFWDGIFFLSSFLLVIFFGAALGNVVRGVPLYGDGYFFEALWTTFTVVPDAGILDWFTVLMALVAVCTLLAHGANYIAMKTENELQLRARNISAKAGIGALLFSLAGLISITIIKPQVWNNYSGNVWGYIFPVMGLAGITGMIYYSTKKNNIKNKDMHAFLSSSLFIAGMLASTAFGIYPVLLPSSIKPEYSLTVYNSKSGDYSLNIGLIWWIIGMVFVTAYFVYTFYMFRGKVKLSNDEEGY